MDCAKGPGGGDWQYPPERDFRERPASSPTTSVPVSLDPAIPFTRAELLDLLPDKWPGLARALAVWKRSDPISPLIARKLLSSAKLALESDLIDETRVNMLDMLAGAVVCRDVHDARVRELHDAANRAVEQRRAAESQFATYAAALPGIVMATEATATFTPTTYDGEQRERAVNLARQAIKNGHSVPELVDLVAEALGMERAGR